MTRNDIDRIYTDKVTELLAKGFTFHTASMGGSQGEIAHTDLLDGSRIYRVLMDNESSFGENYGDYIFIRVGLAPEDSRNRSTIWNNRLTILSEIRLVRISKTFYTTPEEGRRMAGVRYRRWGNSMPAPLPTLGDAYKSVALKWLRKQPHMKTCRLEDITELLRTTYNGKVRYVITARGKTFLLHA